MSQGKAGYFGTYTKLHVTPWILCLFISEPTGAHISYLHGPMLLRTNGSGVLKIVVHPLTGSHGLNLDHESMFFEAVVPFHAPLPVGQIP